LLARATVVLAGYAQPACIPSLNEVGPIDSENFLPCSGLHTNLPHTGLQPHVHMMTAPAWCSIALLLLLLLLLLQMAIVLSLRKSAFVST
jgi:hypothetical protein